MPEIAEVEIVRRGLERLVGQKLLSFEVEDRYLLSDKILGKELDGVIRKGKFLGLQFADFTLQAHLRMTGLFAFEEGEKWRAVFQFSSDRLYFEDPRGFGTLQVIPSEEFAHGLGPDLFSLPRGWIPETTSSMSVKGWILDQTKIAGIGNYLADESLWRAAVSPLREARSISEAEWKEIISSARGLARKVLRRGGVSIRDYKDTLRQEGRGEALLQVYGRSGEECMRCGRELEKTRVAGRGTTWCPACQS